MKKTLLGIALIAFFPVLAQQNAFFARDFWKENTSVEEVKAAIAEGNSPSQLNEAAFDATALAILGKVPTATAIYLIEQPGNDINKRTHDGRTYLFWAASTGNIELIQYLIDKGSDLYAKDTKGYTPVTFAALFGITDPAVYELFFKAGINPKERYAGGETLLMKLIPFDNEQLTITQFFVNKGLRLKDKGENGATLFDYATRKGNLSLLKALRKKVRPTSQALPMAAEGIVRQPNNSLDLYKYLVQEQKINANAMDSKGANALHYLARRQDLPSITYLINKGAQTDLVDKDGNTPLMNACYGTNLDIVKALYKDQSLVNKINKKGDTALQIALQRSNNEVVAFLLAEGATINAVNNKGENLIEALLKGYNPRKKDGEADFDKKVALLQKYKVSLEQPNVQGNTALHIAIQRGNRKLIEKVLPWVNINAKNKEGETALIKAAMVAKDTEVLEYLISKGADKTSTTELGETAYDLAKENESLQKSGANLEFLK